VISEKWYILLRFHDVKAVLNRDITQGIPTALVFDDVDTGILKLSNNAIVPFSAELIMKQTVVPRPWWGGFVRHMLDTGEGLFSKRNQAPGLRKQCCELFEVERLRTVRQGPLRFRMYFNHRPMSSHNYGG
jgi:hypothetical protein